MKKKGEKGSTLPHSVFERYPCPRRSLHFLSSLRFPPRPSVFPHLYGYCVPHRLAPGLSEVHEGGASFSLFFFYVWALFSRVLCLFSSCVSPPPPLFYRTSSTALFARGRLRALGGAVLYFPLLSSLLVVSPPAPRSRKQSSVEARTNTTVRVLQRSASVCALSRLIHSRNLNGVALAVSTWLLSPPTLVRFRLPYSCRSNHRNSHTHTRKQFDCAVFVASVVSRKATRRVCALRSSCVFDLSVVHRV